MLDDPASDLSLVATHVIHDDVGLPESWPGVVHVAGEIEEILTEGDFIVSACGELEDPTAVLDDAEEKVHGGIALLIGPR